MARLRDEIAEAGTDVFCRRRYERDGPIPQRLSVALIRAPVIPEWNLNRVFARNWTDKRRRTLTMVAEGKCNKEIAVELGISHAGATDHVRCVMHLLHASNRAHAVHLAHLEGLL